MGSVEGTTDDLVISRAGAIWLSGEMEGVKEIDVQERKKGVSRKGHVAIFR
jgi:hypothetical protein